MGRKKKQRHVSQMCAGVCVEWAIEGESEMQEESIRPVSH